MLTIETTIVLVILGLFAAFTLYFLIPSVMKIILQKRFLAIVAKSNGVCLTFDDGPNPKSTAEILKLLKEAKAKATFFVLGKNMEAYPDIATQLRESEHEIGEHSYRHMHPWKCGPIQSLGDLIRGNHSIGQHRCSNKRVLFRPPYGKLNLVTFFYVLFLRRQPVFWNINPRDYEQESAKVVLQHVTDRIFPGAVVLLHDGRRNHSASSDVTVMALRSILEEIANRGLTLLTVSEALGETCGKHISPLRESAVEKNKKNISEGH